MLNVAQFLSPIEYANFISETARLEQVRQLVLARICKIVYTNRELCCSVTMAVHLNDERDLYWEVSKCSGFRNLFDRPEYTDKDWHALLRSKNIDHDIIVL